MRKASPLLFGAFLLVAWEASSQLRLVNPHFLPPPSRIVTRLAVDLTNTGLLKFFLVTFSEAIAGTLLAATVALPLGYLVAKSPVASRLIEPYSAASQALPAVALAPLLAIWFGYGTLPITMLCALIVFFPIQLGTTLGLNQIPRDIIDAARLDGAGNGRLLRHIELRLALPSLLTGLRNGLTLSVTGAVVGEFTMGGRGLGMVLSIQFNANDTVGLFATLVLLAGTAMCLYATLMLVEQRLEIRP